MDWFHLENNTDLTDNAYHHNQRSTESSNNREIAFVLFYIKGVVFFASSNQH